MAGQPFKFSFGSSSAPPPAENPFGSASSEDADGFPSKPFSGPGIGGFRSSSFPAKPSSSEGSGGGNGFGFGSGGATFGSSPPKPAEGSAFEVRGGDSSPFNSFKQKIGGDKPAGAGTTTTFGGGFGSTTSSPDKAKLGSSLDASSAEDRAEDKRSTDASSDAKKEAQSSSSSSTQAPKLAPGDVPSGPFRGMPRAAAMASLNAAFVRDLDKFVQEAKPNTVDLSSCMRQYLGLAAEIRGT